MRVITGLGIAQTLCGILVNVFKNAPIATLPIGVYLNRVVGIGWPFLLLGSLLLIGGWTYLLAGALQARWWISVGTLLLATNALWQMVSAADVASGRVAALCLWLYGLARTIRCRHVHLWVDPLILALLVATINLGAFVAALLQRDASRLMLFSLAVSGQTLVLLVLLVPVLIIAGVDLTEISAETGSWLTERVLGPLRSGFSSPRRCSLPGRRPSMNCRPQPTRFSRCC